MHSSSVFSLKNRSNAKTLLQAVVLSTRPPISLKRTTVSPGVLEELLGEIGSLASVYHKPAETFVGRGRVGADALRKNVEYAVLCPILLVSTLYD
jgi:hypothetical protein